MRKHLINIHIAVFFFGLAGIVGKLTVFPSIIIVLGRTAFGALALFAFLKFKRTALKLREKKDYRTMLLLGALLAFHWFTFFESIRVSTVAVGLLTYSTFPIWTTLLAPSFLGDQLTRRDFILSLITFGGVIIIIRDFNLDSSITKGAIWGLLSGLSFAFLSLLNKKIVAKYPGSIIAFYQDGVAACLLLPLAFFWSAGAFGAIDILLLVILGVVFTALAHTLFINGLSTVSAQSASIISSLEPVYGILIALLFLQETPHIREIIGGVLILGATTYATVTSVK